jgi:hypothetical protein
MSTVNGIGTLRYGWDHHPDGTASATLWFVIGFLPVVPLRRERLCVVSDGLEPSRAIDVAGAALGAAVGVGTGFRSQLQVLQKEPIQLAGILRTYFFGFVVTPLLAFGAPLVGVWASVRILELLKFNMREYGVYVAITLGIASVAWAGVVIAKILDRAAGRTKPRRIDRKVDS